MPLDLADEKQQAPELIDRLDAGQVAAIVKLLQFMLLDPVSRAIACAPEDDEPETPDERHAVAESKEWFRKHGKGIPHEEILREFGLK